MRRGRCAKNQNPGRPRAGALSPGGRARRTGVTSKRHGRCRKKIGFREAPCHLHVTPLCAPSRLDVTPVLRTRLFRQNPRHLDVAPGSAQNGRHVQTARALRLSSPGRAERAPRLNGVGLLTRHGAQNGAPRLNGVGLSTKNPATLRSQRIGPAGGTVFHGLNTIKDPQRGSGGPPVAVGAERAKYRQLSGGSSIGSDGDGRQRFRQ